VTGFPLSFSCALRNDTYFDLCSQTPYDLAIAFGGNTPKGDIQETFLSRNFFSIARKQRSVREMGERMRRE
jgi:hypothetical protein